MTKNRREILKQGVSSLAFALMSSTIKPIFAVTQDILDVAIIGGGLAGLSFAYKLKNKNLSTVIFEASATKLGGRIRTLKNFNSDQQYVELGAEYLNKNHFNTLNICKELGLKIIDVNSPLATKKNMDVFYCDNRSISQNELNEVSQILLNLINNDLKNAPKDEIGNILWPDYTSNNEFWNQLDKLSVAEYLYKFNQYLPKWYHDLILNGLATLNGTDTSIQSCISLLQFFPKEIDSQKFSLWQECDESLKIVGGNSSLIKKLKDDVSKKTTINMEYKLIKIVDKINHFILTFATPSGIKEVKSYRVVLAVPCKILKEIEGINTLELSKVKKDAIQNYGFGTNAKIILRFNNKIWTEKNQKTLIEKRLGSDEICGAIWESTRHQKGAKGALTLLLGGKTGEQQNKEHYTMALKLFSKLYPNITNYYDNRKTSLYWTQQPLIKGSYSSPLIGQFTSLYGCWKQPELNNRLHFIGEHVSTDYYGYMEGACESACQLASQF